MSREVPEGWRVVAFSDIASDVSIRNRGRDQIPVLSVTKYDGFVPSEEYFRKKVFSADTENYKIVRKGQFAYATIHLDEGSIDRLTQFDAGLISPMYTVFQIDDTQASSDFILRLFKSYASNGKFDALGNGGVNRRKSISFSTLGKLSIPLPPLHEQRRIAEILSSVDEAIAATRAVIEQTRKVKQSTLGKLFHRGNWADAELPDGHVLMRLEDLARRGSGHTPSKTFNEYWNGGVSWVSLQDTKALDRRYISQTSANISDLGIKNSSAEIHPAGTVFVSRDATVGRVGIMQVPMAVSQHFISWVCGPMLDKQFLYYWLLNMKPVFERIAAGSTIKTIGLPFFKELRITLPDLTAQKRIASQMMSIDDGLDAAEASLAGFITVKSALMSDLLTGRKRVTDALPIAAE